jgi:uncharacterized membrane protein
MDKLIVVVFDNERQAYEGSKSLKNLHQEGSLTLYQSTVISKDTIGKVKVKESADPGPVGTALGWATGGLIGLLGGPLGFAVGALGGTLAGSIYDVARVGVGADFVDEVSEYLLPGKSAVVAEIEEEWVTPLDTQVDTLGGTIFRRSRSEFVDEQLDRDVETARAEIEQLEAEYKREVGEAKAKVKAKLDAAEKRMEAKRDQIKDAIQEANREFEAKLNSLQTQFAHAKYEKKADLEKRIAELKTRQEIRTKKLNEAWQLTKEALTL